MWRVPSQAFSLRCFPIYLLISSSPQSQYIWERLKLTCANVWSSSLFFCINLAQDTVSESPNRRKELTKSVVRWGNRRTCCDARLRLETRLRNVTRRDVAGPQGSWPASHPAIFEVDVEGYSKRLTLNSTVLVHDNRLFPNVRSLYLGSRNSTALDGFHFLKFFFFYDAKLNLAVWFH
jgi:hypothetical protein